MPPKENPERACEECIHFFACSRQCGEQMAQRSATGCECYETVKSIAADWLIDRLTAERDAAIVDLKIFAGCAACKHCCNHRRYHQESLLVTCFDCAKKQNCKCGSCSLGRSNWEWRGLPESPEEGEKEDA